MKECPCSSGKKYSSCCEPFHGKERPKTALEQVRARYSAYALGLVDYLIKTTHPASTEFSSNLPKWKEEIREFCEHTEFQKLEILDAKENGAFATITFVAHLTQDKKDVSFTEKSTLEKIKGRWFYRNGKLKAGHAPNLITTHQPRVLPIAYYNEPILRKKAEPVGKITNDLRTLVSEMTETMDACDGMGLAAPQVHHSIRLFIMRKPTEEKGEIAELGIVKVFINPVLSAPSEETWKASEGCLSIPAIRGQVERPREISVEYLNLDGEKVTERLSGWEARVVMHENDHINGTLFIDRMSKGDRQKIEPFLETVKNKIHDGKEL